MAKRINGVLVSMVKGKVLGFALFNLQERGRMLIDPNVDVYEGQIIGIHSRGNDLVVNPTKGKQLTNMRASGTDENIVLTPPIRFSLEQALDFIEDDELVEVTPNSLRIRKKLLRDRTQARRSLIKLPVLISWCTLPAGAPACPGLQGIQRLFQQCGCPVARRPFGTISTSS